MGFSVHTPLSFRGNMAQMISEKSGFVETNKINSQRPKDKPVDGKNSPWDFRCPQYDERSSNFVNAGTHYGVGLRQPVGHPGIPSKDADTLPKRGSKVKTLRDDEKG